MTIQAEIDQAKLNPGSGFFANVLSPANDEPDLISALEKLGRLPSDFDGSLLLPLLNHSNPKIRNLAVKNIGKLRDESFLVALSDFANAETNTFARREAVSALGRLKTPKAISILKRFLADSDPKVILQALRGLLYFRDREDVRNFLTPLCEHSNELIREHAIRELNGQRRDKSKVSDHTMSPDALKNVIVCADGCGRGAKGNSRRIGTSDIHIAALLQCA